MPKTKTKTKILILLLCLSLFSACSEKKEEKPMDLKMREEQAVKIAEEAQYLAATGKRIESLKMYKRVAREFPQSEAKKQAEAKLLSQGISINAPLLSYTSQQMIYLENRILSFRKKNRLYPTDTEIIRPMDAWGSLLFFKYFPDNANYDFIVYSQGPDRKKKSQDDILIVHTLKQADGGNLPEYETVPKRKDEKRKKKKMKKRSLKEIKELAKDSKKTNPAEIVTTLDKLRTKFGTNEGNEDGEIEVSIEDLLKEQ